MSPLLELRDFALAAPNGRVLARHVDLAVAAGELVLVAGPNGAGKSTLLRALAQPPAAARGAAASPRRRHHFMDPSRIAFLPQLHDRAFHIPLTLRDVVAFGSPRGDAAGVGLLTPDQLDRGWNGASGGERQRALLTACLAADAQLLLFDEPFNHLDDGASRAFVQALRQRLAAGAGAVIAAHAPADLERRGLTATRCLDLTEGPA